MLFMLDSSTQLYVFTAVVIMSFFVASALDGVMESDGFGMFGNLIIVVTGFYLGIWVADNYNLVSNNLTYYAIAGFSGSFLALFVLTIIKSLLGRIA